jgi:peptidoglycan/LPS O-acetylase OafA/YrhL
MVVVAASLAVASGLHLAGAVTGRSSPYDPTAAGIAEAVIGAVLLGSAGAMVRWREHARTIGLAANAFAVIGFLIGLTVTTSGGHLPDIAYHLTVLPILVGTLVVLARSTRSSKIAKAATA